MKRFVAALVIMALVCATCIYCSVSLNRRLQELHAGVSTLLDETQRGKSETLTEKNRNVQALWEKHDAFLHVLMAHRSMDELELNIRILGEQEQDAELTTFRESCERAKMILENMMDAERISLKNIF